MHFLRTALVSTLFGVSMVSFAAMPDADPAAREQRMQEALDHFHAKQAMTQDSPTQAKPMHHAKHRRHAMKHAQPKAQDDMTKPSDTTTKPGEQKQ
jgi:hypothetical protein